MPHPEYVYLYVCIYIYESESVFSGRNLATLGLLGLLGLLGGLLGLCGPDDEGFVQSIQHHIVRQINQKER